MAINSDTDIDICNFALGLNSIDPITSFADGTTESDKARLFYQPTVDDLLIKTGWTFSSKFQQLTPSATELPELPYTTAYQQPSDCMDLRALKLNGNDVPYMIRANFIHTKLGADDLPILDTAAAPNTGEFSAHFKSLLQFRLAALFAASITRNEDIGQLWMNEYTTMLKTNVHRDSVQQTTKAIRPSRFISGRR